MISKRITCHGLHVHIKLCYSFKMIKAVSLKLYKKLLVHIPKLDTTCFRMVKS